MVAGWWRALFLVGGDVGGLGEGVHDLVVKAQVQDLVSFPLRQQWVCWCKSNDAEPRVNGSQSRESESGYFLWLH